MEDNKKHIVLQNGYSIAYDDENCYINGILKSKDDKDTRLAKERASELKQGFYNNYFKKHYKNIVILTAAGTSLDNGNNKGKTREGLWTCLHDDIKKIVKRIQPCNQRLKQIIRQKDIEGFLSYIILYEKIHGEIMDGEIHLKKEIEMKIVENCSLTLDSTAAPHKKFLDKITARKNGDSRVQLFTTNYDTLFEQAATGYVIIDGFSFTHPRRFSGRYFDYDIVYRDKTRVKQEESFISNAFHLYKLHGSLNWKRNDNGIVQENEPKDPLIIYPASDKYESSYEQPYFEMMSRFQQALRNDEVLLIVLGFGFQDKHIQNVIKEAVEQNPSFHLVIVNYNSEGTIDIESLKDYFEDTDELKVKRKVSILFDTFSGFTNNYPENKTYNKDENNESI